MACECFQFTVNTSGAISFSTRSYVLVDCLYNKPTRNAIKRLAAVTHLYRNFCATKYQYTLLISSDCQKLFLAITNRLLVLRLPSKQRLHTRVRCIEPFKIQLNITSSIFTLVQQDLQAVRQRKKRCHCERKRAVNCDYICRVQIFNIALGSTSR